MLVIKSEGDARKERVDKIDLWISAAVTITAKWCYPRSHVLNLGTSILELLHH